VFLLNYTKAVKHNKDGSYYKFVKTFRLSDGVEKVISVNSKIIQIASCNNNKNPIKRQKEII